ncbi:hypothetical protein [Hoylesella enoeca]|nr:hypothetical protein [Hoylesella enoeca]
MIAIARPILKEIDVLVCNAFECTTDYYTNETETTLLKSFLGFPGDTKGY